MSFLPIGIPSSCQYKSCWFSYPTTYSYLDGDLDTNYTTCSKWNFSIQILNSNPICNLVHAPSTINQTSNQDYHNKRMDFFTKYKRFVFHTNLGRLHFSKRHICPIMAITLRSFFQLILWVIFKKFLWKLFLGGNDFPIFMD